MYRREFFMTSYRYLAGKRQEANGPLCAIFDDAGDRPQDVQLIKVLAQYPVTVAVLPQSPYTAKVMQECRRQKRLDIILHQPMEPDDRQNPGRGAIYAHHTEKEMLQIVNRNLELLGSGVKGLNNHMGSKVTRDYAKMLALSKYCKDRGIIVVDSMTHEHSRLYEAAKAAGALAMRNRAFIDKRPDAVYNTSGVVIGHFQARAGIDAFLRCAQTRRLLTLTELVEERGFASMLNYLMKSLT
jgi:polysaccharide deacetylase 2 family uncharacterized protein YibQ